MSEIKEIELQPDPVRAIESLRDTGYSFNTAIADIVDTSGSFIGTARKGSKADRVVVGTLYHRIP